MLIATAIVVGLALLTLGGEFLVRGASKIAAACGVSSLVIGLTVVAFGTSAPEMAVSVGSALTGQSDIALGNVLGSNIFNVLFILGACALLAPLKVNKQLVQIDVPIMILASVCMLLCCLDREVSRLDGCLLFAGIIIYSTFSVIKSRRDVRIITSTASAANDFAPTSTENRDTANPLLHIVLIVAGLALLLAGAKLFVYGSVETARSFGVSELVIGLTLVAAGTSLPEVATSIMATVRGERDIAIGNVVGSNIFNIFSVLGATAIASPISVPESAISFDIPIMLAVAIVCFPIFRTHYTISRTEGALFFAAYVAYTAILIYQ